MKAIAYCRVSSEGQAKEGVSLDAQEARIKAWANEKGHELVQTYVDAGISGKRMTNRPALLKALNHACQINAVLVVYSLSRASRSIKDSILIVETLHKAKADLVSLTENIDTTTASGKLVFSLFISLAEHERNLISERTRAALSYLKKQGKRVGTVGYGFTLQKDGKTLKENAKEQGIIKSIYNARKGGQSYWAIAKALNGGGIPTKKHGSWSAGTVFRIYRGLLLEEKIAA
jgi:site-specific DNA recombinase